MDLRDRGCVARCSGAEERFCCIAGFEGWHNDSGTDVEDILLEAAADEVFYGIDGACEVQVRRQGDFRALN